MGDNPLLAKLAMDNYAKHNDNMRALIRYEDVPNKLWTIPVLLQSLKIKYKVYNPSCS